jgi:hypothetical protein
VEPGRGTPVSSEFDRCRFLPFREAAQRIVSSSGVHFRNLELHGWFLSLGRLATARVLKDTMSPSGGRAGDFNARTRHALAAKAR